MGEKRKAEPAVKAPSSDPSGHLLPAGEKKPQVASSPNAPYRFKLPRIPRTIARPTWVATVRVTLFIAASMIVSRW
ncbi:hypothetical protein PMI07_003150 [Rhizobium sp. CF080]|nr:hypothetical protein PMI07_003150 [Rhizobium sp. CF080]